MTWRDGGFAYFIGMSTGEGPIKIGYSSSPERRLQALMAWAPYPLEILAAYKAHPSDEFVLHDLFRHDRRHSEWFDRSPELLALIEQVKATGTGPGLEWPPRATSGTRSRIRDFREGQGFTLEQFAEICDVPVDQVEVWERPQPTVNGMIRVIHAFSERGMKVSVSDLCEKPVPDPDRQPHGPLTRHGREIATLRLQRHLDRHKYTRHPSFFMKVWAACLAHPHDSICKQFFMKDIPRADLTAAFRVFVKAGVLERVDGRLSWFIPNEFRSSTRKGEAA